MKLIRDFPSLKKMVLILTIKCYLVTGLRTN